MRLFSGWTPNPLAHVFVRVMQRGITQSRGSIKWPGRQRWGGMVPNQGRMAATRNWGSQHICPQKLQRGHATLPTPWLHISDFQNGRGSISVFSYQFVVMCCSSHRRLILSTLTLLLPHPVPCCSLSILSTLLPHSSWSNYSWDAVPPDVCMLSSFISFRPLFKLYANIT